MITAVGEDIEPNGHTRVLDVSGKLVTPGLVDLHAHVYDGVTESGLDANIAGVKSGVTTLLDAGSSGSQTFDGLRRYVVSHAQTRIFCLVHIASLGLANMPRDTRPGRHRLGRDDQGCPEQQAPGEGSQGQGDWTRRRVAWS